MINGPDYSAFQNIFSHFAESLTMKAKSLDEFNRAIVDQLQLTRNTVRRSARHRTQKSMWDPSLPNTAKGALLALTAGTNNTCQDAQQESTNSQLDVIKTQKVPSLIEDDLIWVPTISCGICEKIVSDEHAALECMDCLSWIHTVCGGISEDDYKRHLDDSYLPFLCIMCKDEIDFESSPSPALHKVHSNSETTKQQETSCSQYDSAINSNQSISTLIPAPTNSNQSISTLIPAPDATMSNSLNCTAQCPPINIEHTSGSPEKCPPADATALKVRKPQEKRDLHNSTHPDPKSKQPAERGKKGNTSTNKPKSSDNAKHPQNKKNETDQTPPAGPQSKKSENSPPESQEPGSSKATSVNTALKSVPSTKKNQSTLQILDNEGKPPELTNSEVGGSKKLDQLTISGNTNLQFSALADQEVVRPKVPQGHDLNQDKTQKQRTRNLKKWETHLKHETEDISEITSKLAAARVHISKLEYQQKQDSISKSFDSHHNSEMYSSSQPSSHPPRQHPPGVHVPSDETNHSSYVTQTQEQPAPPMHGFSMPPPPGMYNQPLKCLKAMT